MSAVSFHVLLLLFSCVWGFDVPPEWISTIQAACCAAIQEPGSAIGTEQNKVGS